MVFSAEHYASIVHNWVCWAAPVFDPVTGAQLGVIDLLDHLGPHPPDRARHRARDGAADRVGDAALGPPPVARWPTWPASPGLTLTLLGTAEALARRPAAAAQPAADRGARAARPAPRGALARAAARAALRRPGDDLLDAQGRGVPPARGPRRPARARVPTGCTMPVRHRRRARPARCCAAATCARRSTPTAATCCPAPTRPPWSRWPSTSPSTSARRCWPTPSPTPWCATASWRRTTPRWSRCAWPRCGGAPAPRRPAAQGPAGRRAPLTRRLRSNHVANLRVLA